MAGPTIAREEVVVYLMQRLGMETVDQKTTLEKLQRAPMGIPTLRLGALLGEAKTRQVAEAMYEELKERIGVPPEGGVHFIE